MHHLLNVSWLRLKGKVPPSPASFLMPVLLVRVKPCAVHDEVVAQCLLVNAVGDDACFDEVWYRVRALALVFTNASLKGCHRRLSITGEPVAQDGKQHTRDLAP